MADRHPSSRGMSAGVSKPRSGASSSSTHSVRRNLFQSQLTRRPTAPSSSASDAQRGHHHHHHQYHQYRGQFAPAPASHLEVAASSSTTTTASSPPDDIVVRDQNGEIELDDPPTPPIDEPDQVGALEAQHESERERERLAEAVKQYQIDQNSVLAQPEGKDPLSPPRTHCRQAIRVVGGAPLTNTSFICLQRLQSFSRRSGQA